MNSRQNNEVIAKSCIDLDNQICYSQIPLVILDKMASLCVGKIMHFYWKGMNIYQMKMIIDLKIRPSIERFNADVSETEQYWLFVLN